MHHVPTPMALRLLAVILIVSLGVATAPVWLPAFGTALTEDDPPASADAALVLEGTGATATSVAEQWREQGLVRDVVIVEAPVKTHALVAYWSDFVRWGLAPPSPTLAEYLSVVRSPSTQAGQQATAALPALQAQQAHDVLVLGGGGIGSRLVERQVSDVLQPAGISSRIVRYSDGSRDPRVWYQNAEDRRAVLDGWLQVLVPYLSGYDADSGA
ncbi:MAG: hypothetical protein JO352_22900 [Chloroflexi bacterium]|nr:hypothetical protein [Chloroflexota bacterium]